MEWIRGTADDLRTIAAGYRGVGAITVANAIHLIDRDTLFTAAALALKPGRGLAIIANGTPLWLQDAAWSVALRAFLQHRLGARPTSYCVTDDASRSTYRRELTTLGYTVDEVRVTYTDALGGVFSAMSGRDALVGTDPFLEYVDVGTLVALRP